MGRESVFNQTVLIRGFLMVLALGCNHWSLWTSGTTGVVHPLVRFLVFLKFLVAVGSFSASFRLVPPSFELDGHIGKAA